MKNIKIRSSIFPHFSSSSENKSHNNSHLLFATNLYFVKSENVTNTKEENRSLIHYVNANGCNQSAIVMVDDNADVNFFSHNRNEKPKNKTEELCNDKTIWFVNCTLYCRKCIFRHKFIDTSVWLYCSRWYGCACLCVHICLSIEYSQPQTTVIT